MLEERIAIVETKVTRLETSAQQIIEKLDQIETNQNKQKGFIGGIVFIGSSVVAFFTMIGPLLVEWYKSIGH